MADSRSRYLQMPMPPGWEVKYDFSSQKYFFIDHNNKCTAWEDPRPGYYARMERQQAAARKPSPQPSANRFSQAVTSLNGGRSPAATARSPARRPETIQLQQVPKNSSRTSGHRSGQSRNVTETAIDPEEEPIPTLAGDEFEIAVLQSKFPNASKEEVMCALKSAKRERPNRSGGQVNRASDLLRQQAASAPGSAAHTEKERALAARGRTLHADFPQLSLETVMTALRDADGHLYTAKQRLHSMLEVKTKALAKKYPGVQPTLIAELQREAAGRSDSEAFLERRLEVLQAEAGGATASPRQRHPSPQPRSVVEGEDSLERQRAHRQLVVELSREFPHLERALVRGTLASVNWSLQRGREKLQSIRASGNSGVFPTERSASPASSVTPAMSPSRSQTSRGPSPRPPSVGPARQPSPALAPQPPAAVPVVKPKAEKAKPKTKKATAAKGAVSKPASVVKFAHATLAKGADPELPRGHDADLVHGPDATLHRGPDPSLALGPGSSTGAQLGLSRGADAAMSKGVRTRE